MSEFRIEQTLQQIFTGNLLIRIPDYQRGYSWETPQLSDLWEDLINLNENKKHYTGMLTFTEAPLLTECEWTGASTRYIVDGQQRITSLIILLKCILDQLETNEINNVPVSVIFEKYMYKTHPENNKIKCPIFSYSADLESNKYFKKEILGLDVIGKIEENYYIKNLHNAKIFFNKKLSIFKDNGDLETIKKLYEKVISKLMFNEYIINHNKEVAIVFETMNNRGKDLSKLELLKNRLLYLCEMIKIKEEEKFSLRKTINSSWSNIYEWLGKGKTLLSDDDFLKNHWIVYYTYNRKIANAFAADLLQTKFSIKRYFEKNIYQNKLIDYDEIYYYVKSLSDLVPIWFFIHFPSLDIKQPYCNSEIILRIQRMNRLGFVLFKPLLLSILYKYKESDKAKILEAFDMFEHFMFKIFYITGMPSNTCDNEFYQLAKKYYYEDVKIDEVISKVKSLISEKYKFTKFIENMDELFTDNKRKGFYAWNGLSYLLYEYDWDLREDSKSKSQNKKLNWHDLESSLSESIEHIFPTSCTLTEKEFLQDKKNKTRSLLNYEKLWQDWKDFDKDNTNNNILLNGSLGNLLPMEKGKNSKLSNLSFNLKKRNGDVGYFNGCASEIEVASDFVEWNSESIFKRGNKILDFMKRRWDINMTKEQESRLLVLKKVFQ